MYCIMVVGVGVENCVMADGICWMMSFVWFALVRGIRSIIRDSIPIVGSTCKQCVFYEL